MSFDAAYPIVVSSCDAFDDVWGPFFTLFFRYWPDCPHPIYLITNHKDFTHKGVQVIKVGEDKKWASNLKVALKQIQASHLIYLQEDYLLRSRVDTSLIDSLLGHVKENRVGYLRLVASPKPDSVYPGMSNVGLLSPEAPYRTSLQAAIWDKDVLDQLLVEGESGWDMEFKGTERSRTLERLFLSVRKNVLDYFPQTAIKKGRWYYDAVKLCTREGIIIDPARRPIESYRQYIWRKTLALPFLGRIIRPISRRIHKIL